jgi:hypothetical protein
MECPFCGKRLAFGQLAVRALGLGSMITVVWKPAYRASGLDPQEVLSPGDLRAGTRPASYCDGCGAVVVDPVVDPRTTSTG